MSVQASSNLRRLRPEAAVLRLGARLLPAPVQRFGLENVLDRLLRSHIKTGDLDFLKGRIVCVAIADLGWRWPLTLTGGSLVCLPPASHSDVVIRGDMWAFLTLVLRCADPDTLFFRRQLVIEGDTELGLATKNFLDSVEWDQLFVSLLLPFGSSWPKLAR